MPKLKSDRKPNPHRRSILVAFKVNPEEMRTILALAHSWTKGNVSKLARYATLRFVPKKGDFEK